MTDEQETTARLPETLEYEASAWCLAGGDEDDGTFFGVIVGETTDYEDAVLAAVADRYNQHDALRTVNADLVGALRKVKDTLTLPGVQVMAFDITDDVAVGGMYEAVDAALDRARGLERGRDRMRRKYSDDHCLTCDDVRANNGFGPSHDASSRCESGKHEHCACDICF